MLPIRILLVDDTPQELAPYIDALRQRFARRGNELDVTTASNAAAVFDLLHPGASFDIVFVDIVGVAYEDVLREVRGRNPYLPIVMFSRQAIPEEIVKCIDLGARSFVFKLDLSIGTQPVGPYDHTRDEMRWTVVLDKIERLVAEYRPLKRVLEAPIEIGRLRKAGGTDSIIGDQIDFLRYVQSIPGVAEWFPAVLSDWKDGGFIYYEMPLYRMKSLRRLLFDEDDREKCLELGRQILHAVLEFAFQVLYPHNTQVTRADDYVESVYFQKFRRREDETKAVLRDLRTTKSGAAIDVYERVLDAETIVVGDRPLTNPRLILSRMLADNELKTRLCPALVSMIHGDLHFDNILVDDRLSKTVRCKLVDPRGFRLPGCAVGSGDFAYDIGKLLHSADGLYDLIHAGCICVDLGGVEYRRADEVRLPSLEFQEWATIPRAGGGSGAIMTSHRRVIAPWMPSVFADLGRFVIESVAGYEWARRDANWLLRARLHEALDFCTMGRFHVREDVGRALAVLVRGVELINDVYVGLQSGLFYR